MPFLFFISAVMAGSVAHGAFLQRRGVQRPQCIAAMRFSLLLASLLVSVSSCIALRLNTALPQRWEALTANCSAATSTTTPATEELSVADASALFDLLALDRRSRSQWLHDIGEWHLHKTRRMDRAKAFFHASADMGHADAQFLKGALGSHDDEEHPEAATTSLLYYHFASQGGGSMSASMALGYRHLHGHSGAPRSCDTALRHYKIAADDVMRRRQALPNPLLPIQVFSIPAPTRLSDDQTQELNADTEDMQRIEYLRRRASHSDNTELLVRTASLVLFSDLYQQPSDPARGEHVQVQQEATVLLQRAAGLGSGSASALLGHVHAYDLAGSPVDVQKAKAQYETALNGTSPTSDSDGSYSGRSEAANGLGLLYLHGLGDEQVDIERAMSYFQLSARTGHADGVFNTATIMATVDPLKSKQYLEASADVGHIGAVFKLARLREKQRFQGDPSNQCTCQAIVQLYKQVAEHNTYGRELLAHAALAVQHSQHDHAIQLYLIAADMGYEVAEHNAAWLMEQFVFTSLPEAALNKRYIRLVRRGVAQKASADALVRAGDLEFAVGNNRRAMVQYLRAVDLDHRHARALFSVGYMCDHGLGTVTGDRNLERARWYYEQVQRHEPLIQYVMAFVILKVDVELAWRSIVESVVHTVHKLRHFLDNSAADRGVILFDPETRDATSEAIVSFVAAMAFDGTSSSVVVEASGLLPPDNSLKVETWLYIERPSSLTAPSMQTLVQHDDVLRVDLVAHSDGSSWQLRVSSASSVLTLTNAAFGVQRWYHVELFVETADMTVSLVVDGEPVDHGRLLVTNTRATQVSPLLFSIGQPLPQQPQENRSHGGGGFEGKLWGFRVWESSLSPPGDPQHTVDHFLVLDLKFETRARFDESTGREQETSELVNRGQVGDAPMRTETVELQMIKSPSLQSKK